MKIKDRAARILVRVFMYFIILFTIIISVFPIIWLMLSAFKTNSEILAGAFTMPSGIETGIQAFKYLFEEYNFLLYAKNSIVVSAVSTLIALLFFAMAGYVLGKYNFPGKNLIFILFTITMLVPGHAKAQPIFALVRDLGLYDNAWGLIMVYLSNGLAISIFILKGAFMSIPKELNEAAMIDGAGFLKIFFSINLPLAKSGLATAGILMFLGNWNEYFYASLLTVSEKNRTLPVALQFFNQSFAYDYTKMFAALTLVILPGIILYACAQEQVQQSVAASGLKG